jgi:hypothetical protein
MLAPGLHFGGSSSFPGAALSSASFKLSGGMFKKIEFLEWRPTC